MLVREKEIVSSNGETREEEEELVVMNFMSLSAE